MADSNITKKALAGALKELLHSEPFSKISVGEICEKCSMNRKSFYYHFRDKYDLMVWIFRSEFDEHTAGKKYDNVWDAFEDLCVYLNDNRSFYRKALAVKGQNSFSEYFRDNCLPEYIEYIVSRSDAPCRCRFCRDFFADAFVCSIERWLNEEKDMSPEIFVKLLSACFEKTQPIGAKE